MDRDRGDHVLRHTLGAVLVVGASLLASACGGALDPDTPGLAKLHTGPTNNVRADHYVVLLRPGTVDVGADAHDLVGTAGGSVEVLYESAVRGFAARIPEAGLASLRADPRVREVYEDLWLAFSSTPPGVQQMDANGDPWGLDRVDQRPSFLDREYVYDATGLGVTVYVVDSGVQTSHIDFGGRAASQTLTLSPPACEEDELDHGTAVASIAAGTTFGVAKEARIVSLRVAPCGDTRPLFSRVLKAVQWVSADADPGAPAVVNFSLGWRLSHPIDPWRELVEDEIGRAVHAGLPFVVSANNVGGDACEWWPARLDAVITVAGTNRGDVRVEDSNFGACVDLFAPGDDILAGARDGGNRKVRGTSFAAPHVTGAVALLLEGTPTLDPAAIKSHLLSNATTGVVKEAGADSPDRLLYVR